MMERQYDKYVRPTDRRKYGSRWKKIRDIYIARHPLCERCLANGKFRAAAEVHHILPVSRGGTNEENNLMALCWSCHQKIHRQLGDRWGGGGI